MKYRFLTPENRKEVKRLLDSGEKTVEEIRNYINIHEFVMNQDVLIPYKIVNDTIDKVNKDYGTTIKHVPVVLKAVDDFVAWDTCKTYECSMEGQ